LPRENRRLPEDVEILKQAMAVCVKGDRAPRGVIATEWRWKIFSVGHEWVSGLGRDRRHPRVADEPVAQRGEMLVPAWLTVASRRGGQPSMAAVRSSPEFRDATGSSLVTRGDVVRTSGCNQRLTLRRPVENTSSPPCIATYCAARCRCRDVNDARILGSGPYFVMASCPGDGRFAGLGRDRLFAV
jgi:hypothetical protein